jgi:hypothetical protein
MVLGVAILLFAAVGFVVGRPLILTLPFAVWGCFFTGAAAGWWGSGLGEAWGYALALTLGASVGADAAGLALRRALTEARSSRRTQRRPPA